MSPHPRQCQYLAKWREIVSVEWSCHLEQIRSSPGCDQYPQHHQNTSPTESHPMHFAAHAQLTANWPNRGNVKGVPFQNVFILIPIWLFWLFVTLWWKESWPITKYEESGFHVGSLWVCLYPKNGRFFNFTFLCGLCTRSTILYCSARIGKFAAEDWFSLRAGLTSLLLKNAFLRS